MPGVCCLLNEHYLSSADDDKCDIPHLDAEDKRRDSGSRCETDGRCALMSVFCCNLGLSGPESNSEQGGGEGETSASTVGSPLTL